FASHSAFRSRVVPEPPEDTTAHRTSPAQGDQLELLEEEDDRAPKALRHRWAWLLAHIFAADLESCPQCGGPMRRAEVAKTARAALRLMAKLGLAPHPPPGAPVTPLGQLSLQFDKLNGALAEADLPFEMFEGVDWCIFLGARASV